MRVRKKPVEVEAYPLLMEYVNEIRRWANNSIVIKSINCVDYKSPFKTTRLEAMIKTLEGEMHAIEGDWIIKGVNGEFYSCKDDIFRKTYDIIDDNVTTNNSEITW